jgi:hypothetical protein
MLESNLTSTLVIDTMRKQIILPSRTKVMLHEYAMRIVQLSGYGAIPRDHRSSLYYRITFIYIEIAFNFGRWNWQHLAVHHSGRRPNLKKCIDMVRMILVQKTETHNSIRYKLPSQSFVNSTLKSKLKKNTLDSV